MGNIRWYLPIWRNVPFWLFLPFSLFLVFGVFWTPKLSDFESKLTSKIMTFWSQIMIWVISWVPMHEYAGTYAQYVDMHIACTYWSTYTYAYDVYTEYCIIA